MSKRILVVEDDRTQALHWAELFGLGGWEVAGAADAEEAVAKINAGFRPDVVLCDQVLPGVNGVGLLNALEARPDMAGVKLVAMTGLSGDAAGRAARALGKIPLLRKPIREAELAAILGGG